MIQTSAEVRWFFPGEPATEIWEWFGHGEACRRQPSRVDIYLVLPGCTATGIKVREGRFEVKALIAKPVATDYPGGVRGFRQDWVKWSLALADPASAGALLAAGEERWVNVRKRRSLRVFSLDDVGDAADPPEVPPAADRPRRGCSVEITEIEVDAAAESTWWSLSLEGYDDDEGAAGETLERGARALFRAPGPPMPLRLEASSSYPAWLLRRTPEVLDFRR